MDEILFENDPAAHEYKKIKNGYVDVADGAVCSLFSTDPADYLKFNIGDLFTAE